MSLNLYHFLISQPLISKDQKKNINCTMDDVGGYFLGPTHGITPAAVTTNKNTKMRSFKSSENIQKKEGGPEFSSLTLHDFAMKAKENIL